MMYQSGQVIGFDENQSLALGKDVDNLAPNGTERKCDEAKHQLIRAESEESPTEYVPV